MAYYANGSEGEILDRQCADCPLGAGWNNMDQKKLFDTGSEYKPCPTAAVQAIHNYDQMNNKHLESAMNILIDKSGICQTRKLLVEIRREQRESP